MHTVISTCNLAQTSDSTLLEGWEKKNVPLEGPELTLPTSSHRHIDYSEQDSSCFLHEGLHCQESLELHLPCPLS